jgi:hypothetical protein
LKLGPEESFKLIVETFRRGVEDIQIGFVMRQEGGHSMMTGRNKVSHELIPPTKDGEPYKATITVTSQSRYSIQRTNVPVESDHKDDVKDQTTSADPLNETDDTSGLEILDPDLVGASGSSSQARRSSAGSTERLVDSRPDQGERKYELVYEKGRWNLVTKLDSETEQSIENAFVQALKTQT